MARHGPRGTALLCKAGAVPPEPKARLNPSITTAPIAGHSVSARFSKANGPRPYAIRETLLVSGSRMQICRSPN